jgi:hypothetical protein
MSSVNRKCPGCRRKMRLTVGNPLPGQFSRDTHGLEVVKAYHRRAAVYYCPFCINLSKRVMQKIEELEKAEKEIAVEQT